MGFMAIAWIIIKIIGWLSAAATLFMALTADYSTGEQGEDGSGLNKSSNVAKIPVVYGTRKIGGVRVFEDSAGTDNKFLYIALSLCEGPIEEISEVYISDTLVYQNGGMVAGNQYEGKLLLWLHLGDSGQSADSNLISVFPGKWTASHKLSGVAYIIARFEFNTDVYSRFPSIQAVVKGKRILDVRDSVTKFSNNPALCLYDYLTNTLYGKGLSPNLIDENTFQIVADYCDMQVQEHDSTTNTYPLLSCDIILDTEEQLLDNIKRLLYSCRATMPFVGGVHRLVSLKDSPPTFDFNASNILGGWKIEGAKKSDRLNAIEIEFTNPDSEWKSDILPLKVDSYLTEDGGFPLSRTFKADWLISRYAATDYANLKLKASRQKITCAFTATPSAVQVDIGDIVTISHVSVGWVSKLFLVVGMQLLPDGVVGLSFVEHEPTVYDRDVPVEYTPPADTFLPNPEAILAPVSIVLTSGDSDLLAAGDGTIVSRIRVSWSAPTGYPYIVGYVVEFKKKTDISWFPGPQVLGTSKTEAFISPVDDGVAYEVQVRTVGPNNMRSLPVSSIHQVIGKLAPPPDVDTFLVFRQPDGTRVFDWTLLDPPPDLAGYRIKYKLTAGQVWEDLIPLHKGLLTAAPFESNQLAAGTYTVGIVAVDTSGNESQNPLLISSTLGDPRIKGSVYNSRVQSVDPIWAGTKTDCFVDYDNGVLLATDSKDWDSFAVDGTKWDDWATWARSPNTTFTYEHPAYDSAIDLGAVVSVTPLVSVDGVGTLTVEEQHSDDNTTFTPYAVIGPLISARYIRLKVTVSEPTLLAQLSGMEINLSADPVDEYINDKDTSTISSPTGVFRLPISKSYATITQVTLAIQGTGGGWTWKLIDKDPALGPKIELYNGSGVLADAVIDAVVRGI